VLDGIQKLHSMMACSGGEISNLRSPLGGHAGERDSERERERAREEGGGLGGGRRTREVGGSLVASTSWEIVMKLSPLGSLYI
jgi:hypothetical protein